MLAPCLPIAIWSAHFGLVYGLTALACARQLDLALPWALSAAALAAVLALGAAGLAPLRRAAHSAQFTDILALGLGALAAVAIVWETSAVFGVASCA